MTMAVERLILSGMPLLVDDEWVMNHAVVLENSRIKAIIPVEMMSHHLPATHYSFPADHFLVPGFIDLHVHGAAGADVMDADAAALNVMSQALAKEGVTGFLATTMTASATDITRALTVIANTKSQCRGAAILGVHLEGPFIAKDKMGAQNDQYIIEPDLSLINEWQMQSGNNIKMVTLAPELKGAIPLIEALAAKGMVVALGHTNASCDVAQTAIAAGASYATHLFNAMRGLHHREPGVVGAVLLSQAVTAELIADGHHLHPTIIDLVLRLKDKNHLVLITDAMRAKCLREGSYDLGGQKVNVKHGKATLDDGTLAGSVLTMNQAIQFMCQKVGVTLADAVCMASDTPARVLGLSETKGSIHVEKDADLVVLDSAYQVRLTIKAGQVIYMAESN